MSADLRRLAGQPVIVGAGIAGLVTAFRLAPQPVVLLSKGRLMTEASSVWAQGGLAAALGPDDGPDLHVADTLAAGDGLSDAGIARRIAEGAPAAVEMLAGLGCAFDRDRSGALALGLEAAHSRRRIVHARGDATGREIMRVLAEAARRTPSVTILEGFEARRLRVEEGRIAGLLTCDPFGRTIDLPTDRVVIATGGVGGLFPDTTNPVGSFGQGLVLAARAGAVLMDLEFVQFHPTALDGTTRPLRLVSEAVRGEGATLIDERGHRFMADEPGAELAPRDIVARRIWRHRAAGHHVFLDARKALGERFAVRFPAIAASCREAGIDPARMPIPVRPAAHYHMGGIAVDGEGRSSVPGLWACGEAACTGLHGANRLASNSLTEAIVCGGRVSDSIAGTPAAPVSPRPRPAAPMLPAPDARRIHPLVGSGLGVMRGGEGLAALATRLLAPASGRGAEADPAAVALMMAVAALRREESRGAHCRSDFPKPASSGTHSRLRLDEAMNAVRDLAGACAPALVEA
ncbi:L-aspartate oxidase [Enterovirga sp.]|uniref:L-aspartate oxidase n=1 Tax=Enterovirga sp. TaxID=2026350 RepID=UPI002B516344|nr:L-aspartate oxidase [Enterovirga sp.]HMO30981.1 L-aspartate oxidase [Enterovirga sp.]